MKYVETAAIAATLLAGSWALAQPEGVERVRSAQTLSAIGGCSTSESLAGQLKERRDAEVTRDADRI